MLGSGKPAKRRKAGRRKVVLRRNRKVHRGVFLRRKKTLKRRATNKLYTRKVEDITQPISMAPANQELPHVSVVIPAMNEARTIGRVIRSCQRIHPKTEVIVVVNGSSDNTKTIAEKNGARVIYFPYPIGHDVGRSIGAQAARGKIILFTDGDIVFQSKDLRKLVEAVNSGTDVALNKYEGPVHKKNVHRVVLAKFVLNAALYRADLGGTSMTTIPHALSRRALEMIGPENLSVPPKAHAMAIHGQLNIRPVHYFNVGKTNPRKRRKYRIDPLEPLIFGDHLEAIHWSLQATDGRYRHSDLSRRRDLVR